MIKEETGRLVKTIIFADVVQATREVAKPYHDSKLQAYQLGDPSPDFNRQHPIRVLLAKMRHAISHAVKERIL